MACATDSDCRQSPRLFAEDFSVLKRLKVSIFKTFQSLFGIIKVSKKAVLFYDDTRNRKSNIGMWKIVLNQITDADFVIGYGFDNNEKLWKVYQNNERGMKAEWTFENEEEALEKLYKKVKFQYKIIN